MNKVVFLDRDGIVNVDTGYVIKITEFEFYPRIFDVCRLFISSGYQIIIITNQAGIAKGYYSEQDFLKLTQWMKRKFNDEGISILDVYYCPHHPDYTGLCYCRKPNPGMILQAFSDHNIDIENSIFIGDKNTDVIAAQRAGMKNIFLIKRNYEILDRFKHLLVSDLEELHNNLSTIFIK